MSLLQAVLLGVLQGATEFLPVSSSGHLVLVPWLLGWPSPGLAFDAVVHWGTALAVIAYFWRDWIDLIREAVLSLVKPASRPMGAPSGGSAGEGHGEADALAWLILLGTVPGVLVGYLLQDFFEAMFARPAAAAGFLLITAVLLVVGESLGRRERGLRDLGWVDALIVGVGQALAILPGISRSGATIAAGLLRGMKREPAARFSFLLATPIILGAGVLELVELTDAGALATQAPALILGFAASGVVGFICVHLLLRYLRQRRLYPFALYCGLLGILALVVHVLR